MAVALGNDPAKPPVVIADVADNPGGGGRGNTAWLLKGLYEASAKDAILGVFFDAPLAAESHGMRVGDTFKPLLTARKTTNIPNLSLPRLKSYTSPTAEIVGRDPAPEPA